MFFQVVLVCMPSSDEEPFWTVRELKRSKMELKLTHKFQSKSLRTDNSHWPQLCQPFLIHISWTVCLINIDKFDITNTCKSPAFPQHDSLPQKWSLHGLGLSRALQQPIQIFRHQQSAPSFSGSIHSWATHIAEFERAHLRSHCCHNIAWYSKCIIFKASSQLLSASLPLKLRLLFFFEWHLSSPSGFGWHSIIPKFSSEGG